MKKWIATFICQKKMPNIGENVENSDKNIGPLIPDLFDGAAGLAVLLAVVGQVVRNGGAAAGKDERDQPVNVRRSNRSSCSGAYLSQIFPPKFTLPKSRGEKWNFNNVCKYPRKSSGKIIQ
jgi:hypothetical protein